MPGMHPKCPMLQRVCPSFWTHAAKLKVPFRTQRAFHSAKADFITIGTNGTLLTRQPDIFIGDPHEAYIIIDINVGLTFRSAIAKQAGLSLTADPNKVPLAFHHDSRHFAHQSIPYPRIIIERDLPRQSVSNMSPATLWLWGATHCITLDGTPDHEFEESCRESHERLKGAMDILAEVGQRLSYALVIGHKFLCSPLICRDQDVGICKTVVELSIILCHLFFWSWYPSTLRNISAAQSAVRLCYPGMDGSTGQSSCKLSSMSS
ncbi:uncharacterized protein TCAP_06274 [Tolypocladium capitatum]|uniref:Uncharacterized protein n=1 Tax=Tolypocladium capitatum TaxID=45235 RepID=A0A2K3Q891_9HYPO|nr:uncharacterized protein TCAP_06274 [Tolypocladium capitatum]